MTARIEEIRIQNFRAFENARFTLADLTFLVGRNGAGKSSILDAIEFVREALTDSLPNAINRRSGFGGVRRAGADDSAPLGIAILMRAEMLGRTVRMLYGFKLGIAGQEMRVREVLRVAPTTTQGFVRSGDEVRVGDDFDTGSTHRIAAPKGRLVLPLVVSEGLWEIAFDALAQMRAYEIAPPSIAEPATPGNATNLDRYGRNAADVLREIEHRPEDRGAIVRALGAVAPGEPNVAVANERSKQVIMFFQRAGGRWQGFYADQMSQGTLRALGILLALHQHPEPSLVLIDEIEDSIHPLAVDALLEAIEHSSERFPIIVTTHSPEVLARKQATGERIRAVQWQDGVSRIHRLGKGTLDQLDPVTTVGWLLSTNGLGLAEPPEMWAGDILEWV